MFAPLNNIPPASERSVPQFLTRGTNDRLITDAAVKESRDRVSTAITNSAFKFPMGRTTINLAPADVKKEGPSFDLPIAVGMLAASEQFESEQLENFGV
jgi:predicted ATPase with chaperone activity